MDITPRFWLANRVAPWSIDLIFHVASAGILSDAAKVRFRHAGLDAARVDATLRRIRAVNAWDISWVTTGRHYLRDARAADKAGDSEGAAEQTAAASMCYHFAMMFAHDDPERRAQLGRRMTALFSAAAPSLPGTPTRVEIPWRSHTLPGYLMFPATPARARTGLLVLLNGASTVKEETARWARPFLDTGLAVLAIDTPGSGELWGQIHGDPRQIDIADAIIEFAERHPALDPSAVVLAGISLRGALAVQLGAANADLAGVAAITAPFKPAPYVRHLSALVRREVASVSGADTAELQPLAEEMSLEAVAPRLGVPLFVVGAGNDLVVPPQESMRLYRAAGGPKQMLFLPDANHVGLSHLPEWSFSLARWTASLAADRNGRSGSRRIA